MKILAIHLHSHDTSVALVENGEVKYAVANERFSRRKMDRRVPLLALKNCLEFCRFKPSEIDKVVIVGKPLKIAWWDFVVDLSRAVRLTRGRFLWWLRKPKLIAYYGFISLGIPSFVYRQLIPTILLKKALRGYRGRFAYLHHHFCHLASAYYTSGWDECLVGCIEGSGFHQTLSFYYVKNGDFQLITESKMPHSAGKFYELATEILGFDKYKHAGKITGLAAYGDPQKAYAKVKRLLSVSGTQLRLNWPLYYQLMAFYKREKCLPDYFAGFKKEDLAAAFQKRLEDCVLEIVRRVARKTRLKKIALAGGVVANVKLNQRIHQLPEIDEIYIHQAMEDNGLALGAALHFSFQEGFKPKRLEDVYLGPEYSEKEILKALRKAKVKYKFYKNIEKKIAQLLAQGKVVARFNGRMEYGPRALGNRSILYQPTDPTVNDWLNKRLKRTEFMPFAPVTLMEEAKRCYRKIKGAEHTARFMTITFDCTSWMKKVAPAVVHVDNTARPQLITRDHNLSYYKILKEYYRLTGIPSLINTSFNMHGEPIVCSPEDALRSFQAGHLDYLAIGNYLVEKLSPPFKTQSC